MLYISTITVFIVFLIFHSRRIECFESSTFDPSNDTCPPWFIYNETTSKCQCGNDLGGIVKCNDKEGAQENAIMDCYCMTHDEKLGTIVGSCFFNCAYHTNVTIKDDVDKLYRQLPLNTSELNEAMCGHKMQRTGHLCGKCKEGFQFSAYSYQMECIRCSTSSLRNWIFYLCVAFFPLTIFFFCIFFFRISATSPKLISYVMFAQAVAMPVHVRMITQSLGNYPSSLWVVKIVLAIYGIWNLDFFRTLMPPICLNVSTLQVLALDYAVAVYPLGLVVLTYMLIQLHGRGCMLLVVLWSPFKKFHKHSSK